MRFTQPTARTNRRRWRLSVSRATPTPSRRAGGGQGRVRGVPRSGRSRILPSWTARPRAEAEKPLRASRRGRRATGERRPQGGPAAPPPATSAPRRPQPRRAPRRPNQRRRWRRSARGQGRRPGSAAPPRPSPPAAPASPSAAPSRSRRLCGRWGPARRILPPSLAGSWIPASGSSPCSPSRWSSRRRPRQRCSISPLPPAAAGYPAWAAPPRRAAPLPRRPGSSPAYGPRRAQPPTRSGAWSARALSPEKWHRRRRSVCRTVKARGCRDARERETRSGEMPSSGRCYMHTLNAPMSGSRKLNRDRYERSHSRAVPREKQ